MTNKIIRADTRRPSEGHARLICYSDVQFIKNLLTKRGYWLARTLHVGYTKTLIALIFPNPGWQTSRACTRYSDTKVDRPTARSPTTMMVNLGESKSSTDNNGMNLVLNALHVTCWRVAVAWYY